MLDMAKIIVVSVQWRILVIAGPFWAAYRVRFLDGHHVVTSHGWKRVRDTRLEGMAMALLLSQTQIKAAIGPVWDS